MTAMAPGIHFIALRALSGGALTATFSTCEVCGAETRESPDRPCVYICSCGSTHQIILPSWLPRSRHLTDSLTTEAR